MHRCRHTIATFLDSARECNPARCGSLVRKTREEEPMEGTALSPAATLAGKARTPFPGESADYRKARAALLADEIEFRRQMTRLADRRRALPPGPVITKNYGFKDANGRELGLLDLFGEHQALVTYFWMFGPKRERPCPMCTNWLGACVPTGLAP
jgi:hypothetical protein